MGAYTNFLYTKIDLAARAAETKPALPGHFLRDMDLPDMRRPIIGWRHVGCCEDDLRFPVTDDGELHTGNPFVENPDGSIEMTGIFFGGGYDGPWQTDHEWRNWVRSMAPVKPEGGVRRPSWLAK